jgi:4-carboxymuconolactone decarboxylase
MGADVGQSLGKVLIEVVILRTAHRMNAPYEWAHDVSRARACGMEDARIRSIAGPLEDMAPQDRVLSMAVDELLEKKALSPASRRAVVETVGKDGLFDLIATIGFYTTLAFIVNSFDTPVDPDVAAELADRPL